MISAILAITGDNIIGHGDKLPWPHNKEDMAYFKAITDNSTIVMGRKTWESLPKKPLPNRTNIVISSKDCPEAHGTITSDIITNIKKLEGDVFVIGGATIYNQLIEICDVVYVTRIKGKHKGDVFLDIDKLLEEFSKASSLKGSKCKFETWIRK